MQLLAKEKKMIAGTYKRKVYNSPDERDGATTDATKRAKIVSGVRAHEVNVFLCRLMCFSENESCRRLTAGHADGGDGAENEGLKRLNQGFATEMLTGEERGGRRAEFLRPAGSNFLLSRT